MIYQYYLVSLHKMTQEQKELIKDYLIETFPEVFYDPLVISGKSLVITIPNATRDLNLYFKRMPSPYCNKLQEKEYRFKFLKWLLYHLQNKFQLVPKIKYMDHIL